MSSTNQASTIEDQIWIASGIFILIIASFYFASSFYASIWIIIKKTELFMMKPFMIFLTDNAENTVRHYQAAFNHIKPSQVSLSIALKVEWKLFFIYGWLYPVALVVLGILRIRRKDNFYNTPHTMESLLEQETKDVWRFNRHLTKINPMKETLDITTGKFAIRQKEFDFCIQNKLLTKHDIDDEYYVFNRDLAIKIFTDQMGKLYENFNELRDEERWLLATFLLFSHDKKDEAINILGHASCIIADEFTRKSLNKITHDIIQKYIDTPLMKNTLKTHAYVRTVLMSLFEEAKEMGELAAGKFTWLKLFDRQLWYCLCDVGMVNKGSIESAGPETHFVAEKIFERKQISPQIIPYIDYLELKMRVHTCEQN